ncbi:F/Y rich C-terminus-domain-containing protein, partial [Dissophora ornata]
MGLAKVRKVQLLEKDEAGNVKLPVTVGIITIQSIGDVVYDREAFHNDRYIFPVGYKMSRSYNSMIDLNNQTTYTCSVIDDGEAPKFQIDAEDQPGKPIIAGTATGAWTHVVKAANAIRKRDHSNSASGPDYFGFSNATIAKMIQDLPNVDKCQSYIMQRFEE